MAIKNKVKAPKNTATRIIAITAGKNRNGSCTPTMAAININKNEISTALNTAQAKLAI